jgi:5-methylcytosine-specific restriction endonuclease McrA
MVIQNGKYAGSSPGDPIEGKCSKGHESLVVIRHAKGGKSRCVECHAIRKKQWKQRNSEAVREYDRGWRRSSEAGKAYRARHRAKRRGAATDGLRYIKEPQCVRCGSSEELQVEHLHPIARGGTDYLPNKTTMCGPCNRSKGTMSISDADFLGWFLLGKKF